MQVNELYALIFGGEDTLGPVYERLRQLGIDDPDNRDRVMEAITGAPSTARTRSYRERRKELLLALVDDHADGLDQAADELGAFFDHLRQVGLRGFVAEHLGDDDFTYRPEDRPRTDT